MRPCPIEHQPKGAGLEVARKHCPVDRHRSTKPSVVGMKVCYRMVPLVPVHVDHDTVEGAHPWHVPTRVDGSEYRGREGRSRRCGAYSGIMPRGGHRSCASHGESHSPRCLRWSLSKSV